MEMCGIERCSFKMEHVRPWALSQNSTLNSFSTAVLLSTSVSEVVLYHDWTDRLGILF